MPRPYSEDLREKVLKYLESNNNKKAASKLFGIGIATVFRWILKKKETGHVKPIQRKYAFKRVGDDELTKYIKNNPDHFLYEIAEHFSVSPQAIFYALKKLKITRKKSLLSMRKDLMRKEMLLCKNLKPFQKIKEST